VDNNTELRLELDDAVNMLELLGRYDENLRLIEKSFSCKIVVRGNQIVVNGPIAEAETVIEIFHSLIMALKDGKRINLEDINYLIGMAKEKEELEQAPIFSEVLQVTPRGKQIKPKTLGQRIYVEALKKNDIVFGIGPAGTGKTYLAMAMAVLALKNKQVHRLVLTRPAVEAGEKLGYLPGDMQEKVDPYLRPLYDALNEFLGEETFQKYMEKGIIEVAPLAYMRGRTLDDAYIILDEAQNTTPEQMKMFLTRLGFGSKMVVTGDVTQVDLPRGKSSGLKVVQTILTGIEGVEFISLTDKDVVRHSLVQKIIDAYQKYENSLPNLPDLGVN